MRLRWGSFTLARRGLATSSSKAGGREVFRRATLLPLIRLVHPDLFAIHAPAVRATNLSCVQDMVELWDNLREIESLAGTTLASKSQQGVQIGRPLKTSYALDCYVRTEEATIPDVSSPTSPGSTTPHPVRRVTLTLQTPEPLTKRQSVEALKISQSIQQMQQQLGRFFVLSGIPAEDILAGCDGEAGGGSESANRARRGTAQDDLAGLWGIVRRLSEIDALLFERAVQRRSVGATSFLAMSSKKAKSSTRSRRSKLCPSDIEVFLQSGNVLVRGLTPEQEFAAMARLGDFLGDYGTLVNFSLLGWKRVMIVLCVSASPLRVELNKEKSGNALYSVVELRGVYVVDVPHTFKPRTLLESLRLGLGEITSVF